MLYAIIAVLFVILIILILLAKRPYKREDMLSQMSDKDIEDNIKRLAISLRSGEVVGNIPVVSRYLRRIKKAYKITLEKVRAKEQLYECERWLYENYYAVTLGVKQSDYKNFARLTHKKNVVRIIELARFVVAATNCNINKENVEKTIKEFNSHTPLHCDEVQNLDKAFTYALIERIAEICRQIVLLSKLKAHAEGDAEPVKRLCKFDAYLYFYKHTGKYLDEKYFYKINDINPDNIDLTFTDNLVDYGVVIGNCINSAKSIPEVFKSQFVLTLCSVYDIMSEDEIYLNSDLCSQYAYINAVEKLSSLYGASERSIAQIALKLAKAYGVHFGEIIYDYRYAIKGYLHSFTPQVLKKPTTKVDQRLYGTVIALLSFAFATLSTLVFLPDVLLCVLSGVLTLFASVPLSRFIVRLIVGKILPERSVARMNYEKLPEEGKTLCVVSEFICDGAQAREAISNIRALASVNKDEMIKFAVLADFKPSSKQIDDTDESLIEEMKNLLKGSEIALLVRKREYINGKWMAKERKRGAIQALNEALLTGNFQEFAYASEVLEKPYFVLLLDDDDRLLPGSVKQAVNTMLHPLNAKYPMLAFDCKYSLSSLNTYWAKTGIDDSGVDEYCNYGDFYYKLTGRSIFCGKGIYRLKEFNDALRGKLPDGRILSHDIIEGAICECGSLGITTYEDAPDSFVSYAERQNRWQRGDLLLLPYVFKKDVKQPFYKYVMFFNVLSAVVPLVNFALLFALLYTKNVLVFVPFGLCFLGIPLIRYGLCLNALNYDKRMRYVLRAFSMELLKTAYDFITLPYYAVNAVLLWAGTLYRLIFAKSRLTEWKTFYSSQRKGSAGRHFALILPSVAVSVALCAITLDLAVCIYLGVYALTACSIYCLSARVDRKRKDFSKSDREFLQNVANRTMRYFEVNLQDNCLICDNYQAFPNKQANSFTSPTNIGFALLSHVSAYVCKRKNLDECMDGLSKSVELIERLEKYRGHLYNWYSLATHKPLSPYFVSSVDSGNFSACLICAKQFVRQFDEKLAMRIQTLLDNTDFSALFDDNAGRFYIGYNRLDDRFEGHYDMMASEARILCYVASCISGERKYWSGLGKKIVALKGNTLLSWSGTAFEYLMPQLFLPDCENSIITHSVKNAVKYMSASKCSGLWGISESGYYEFNEENHYKYKAFGLSALSLRAADDRCVIAPYASALALRYAPQKAIANLKSLADRKMTSSMGFYEALDMTKGKDVVAMHMSHHQGMILCAIVNALYDDYFVKLFDSYDAMRGGRLLLEEKIPQIKAKKREKSDFVYDVASENCYQYGGECKGVPVVNALTNGHFSTVIDSYGNGYSYSKGKYLNRFTGDFYKNQGGFFYIRDDKELYSPTYAPFRKDRCTYTFRPYESVYENLDKNCKMSVYIPQNSNCEIRKITIYNKESYAKKFAVGYCEETCLADFGGAFSHPAFADMFVSSSYYLPLDTLVLKRTARSFAGDCYCSLTVTGVDKHEYESNLFNFIGRERDFDNPVIFDVNTESVPQKDYPSIGDVLNPCLGFTGVVEIAPFSSKEICLIKFFDTDINSLHSSVREATKTDFVKYAYESARLTLMSKTYKYQLNDDISDAICKTATNILYRPFDREKLSAMFDRVGEPLPMGLTKNVKYIYFEYYNQDKMLKNLVYTTIYLNVASVKYTLVIAYKVKGGDREGVLKSFIDITGVADILELEQIKFLQLNGVDEGVVRAVRDGAFMTFGGKPAKSERSDEKLNIVLPVLTEQQNVVQKQPLFGKTDYVTVMKSGKGGFDEKGDYVIAQKTDLPYSNVVCGEYGGFVVTANGGGFDYFGNSNLSRATVWQNNPVFDTPCEEVYICSDGVTRINKLVEGGYVKHAVGYSEFRGIINGISYSLFEGIIADGKGKLLQLKLDKPTHSRDFCIIFAIKAMLSDLPYTQMLFDTSIDDFTVKVSNAINGKSVYIRTNMPCELIADKAFLYGLDNSVRLSESNTSFYNPSHAIRIFSDAKLTRDIRIIISDDYEFISKTDMSRAETRARECALKFSTLNKFELCSKDTRLDLLFNKWLPYQVVSSRLNGKCAYYQAGGATGFRDQLQDCLTMLYIDKDRVRRHILDCAAHQYLEGDVQHWWHPERYGVRTHITDDRLFLPFLAFEYADFTGDESIFDERERYLVSPPLNALDEGRLEVPDIGKMSESLLGHIKRAIDSVLNYGEDGLLLIGGGDWNDALNEIGIREKGQSVWLSMFAVYVMRKYVKYVDYEQRRIYLNHIDNLSKALENSFKDGYFMRAVTDDKEELGRLSCKHFAIDLLCQSWSVIANVTTKSKQKSAMQKAASLIDAEYGIIKLLSPAQTKLHYYGYISSYPEGVRENGGQYTHAAVWYAKALAILRESVEKDGKTYDATDILNMLNPIIRGQDVALDRAYKGEPYVLAGDIYSNRDNYGRMGWSWYTGSASILYDTIIRDFLGIRIYGDRMVFSKPALRNWEGTQLTYTDNGTVYEITFVKSRENAIKIDGLTLKGEMSMRLKPDKGKCQVLVSFR